MPRCTAVAVSTGKQCLKPACIGAAVCASHKAKAGHAANAKVCEECPICFVDMDPTVVAVCDHSICASCIKKHMGSRLKPACPMCRRSYTDAEVEFVLGRRVLDKIDVIIAGSTLAELLSRNTSVRDRELQTLLTTMNALLTSINDMERRLDSVAGPRKATDGSMLDRTLRQKMDRVYMPGHRMYTSQQ